MDPAVRRLTEEMVEVEIGFQLEDFFALIKRLLPSLKYLTWSLEQLENLVDWWQDMEPVMKLAVPKLIDYLDDLEQKGIFRINGAVIEMYGKIAAKYTPEDIDAMGDGFVLMHGLVKKLSNPELIGFLEKMADVPAEVRLEEAQAGGAVRPALEDAQRRMPAGAGGHAGVDPGPGEAEEPSRPRRLNRLHHGDPEDTEKANKQGAWAAAGTFFAGLEPATQENIGSRSPPLLSATPLAGLAYW